MTARNAGSSVVVPFAATMTSSCWDGGAAGPERPKISYASPDSYFGRSSLETAAAELVPPARRLATNSPAVIANHRPATGQR
jgi:hypothetical protein